MRTSPKQLMVHKYIKTRPSILGKLCETCNHLIRLEIMYFARSKYYCKKCYNSKEEVYDDVYINEVTAHDIWLRNERKQVRAVISNIVNDIESLPDGEVSPSVHTIIMRHSIEASVKNKTP